MKRDEVTAPVFETFGTGPLPGGVRPGKGFHGMVNRNGASAPVQREASRPAAFRGMGRETEGTP